MTALAETDEDGQLHYWIHDRCVELGYPEHLAQALVFANVDWHELERLLKDGCPPETALEILT